MNCSLVKWTWNIRIHSINIDERERQTVLDARDVSMNTTFLPSQMLFDSGSVMKMSTAYCEDVFKNKIR